MTLAANSALNMMPPCLVYGGPYARGHQMVVAIPLSDLEAAFHDRGVRVADELVGPLLQRDREGGLSLLADTGLHVHSRTNQVEVVDAGEVLDDDLVLAGLQPRDLRRALFEADVEARPVDARQRRRRGRSRSDHDESSGKQRDECESSAKHASPLRVRPRVAPRMVATSRGRTARLRARRARRHRGLSGRGAART